MLDEKNAQHVVVTDIRMSFFSMVVFMVKAAIAIIPALLILFAAFYAVGFAFGFFSEVV